MEFEKETEYSVQELIGELISDDSWESDLEARQMIAQGLLVALMTC